MINFDGPNASGVVTEAIPSRFHERYFLLGVLLLLIAASSWVASYFEISIMFKVNNIVQSFAIIVLVVLAVSNEVSSSLIATQMDDKCPFVMPQLSNDMLYNYGCPNKYTQIEAQITKLTCPKADIAQVWENDDDMLI